jgi:aspartate kinase
VLKNELSATLAALTPLAAHLNADLEIEEDVSKLSIVGTGMRTHTRVAERMFQALAADNINMRMITTGDIKISVLIDRAEALRALRAVHQAMALARCRPGAGAPVGQSSPPARGAVPAALLEEPSSNGLAAIARQLDGMEDLIVSDVLWTDDHGRITVFDLLDRPGVCHQIFQAVAEAGIVVDMIVQNAKSNGRAELSFSVPRPDVERSHRITTQVVRGIDPEIRVAADPGIAKLFVLGVGMRSHTGVARRMFGALAARSINVSMINTSEVRVSAVVEARRGKEAFACLRDTFRRG